MRDIALTLVIFGSIPVILVKPHIGVLVFSWISYMNPHRFSWGFAYDFRFALLVGVTTILAWLISREPKRLPWNAVTLLLIVLSLWVSVTTLSALYPEPAYAKWDKTIKILLFNGFLTLGIMRNEQRLNALIWVIVASIGFFGVKGGLFTIFGGGIERVQGADASFISDNNSLGLALLVTIPLMRYLQLKAAQWWLKGGLLVVMFLSIIAVLGTHSRGSLVGLAILALSLFVKSRRRFFLGITLCVTVVAGVAIMPESWHARMETIATFEEDASLQGRFNAWTYATNLALKRPILGGGFGAFRGNLDPTSSVGYRNAHSIYFEVLGQHGFAGLAIYLSLGLATFFMGTSILRRTRAYPDLEWARDLATMLQVSLVVYAVAGAFLNLAFFDLFFHMIVIMILTNAIMKEVLAAKLRQEKDRKPVLAPVV